VAGDLTFETVQIRTELVSGVTLGQSIYDSHDEMWAPRFPHLRFIVPKPHSTPMSHVATPAADAALGTVEVEVPATWSNAYVEMVPQTLQLSGLYCRGLGETGCLGDGLAELNWDPPYQAPHIADCDSVIEHKVQFVRSPGPSSVVSLTVDSARFQPSQVKLHWLHSEVAGVSNPTSVAGDIFEFELPPLSDGDRVDYAFVAAGTFLDSACGSRWASAVSPSELSYRSIALSDADQGQWPVFVDAWDTYAPIAANQPGFQFYPPSREAVCDVHFAVPTPCEQISAHEEVEDPDVDGAVGMIEVFEGPPGVNSVNSCAIQAESQLLFATRKGLPPPIKENDATHHHHGPMHLHNADRSYMGYESRASASGDSAAYFVGDSKKFGFKTGLINSSSGPVEVDVLVTYRAKGHVWATATEPPTVVCVNRYLKWACRVFKWFAHQEVTLEAELRGGIEHYDQFGTKWLGGIVDERLWQFQVPHTVDEGLGLNGIAPVAEDTGPTETRFEFTLVPNDSYGFWLSMRSAVEAQSDLGSAKGGVDFRYEDESWATGRNPAHSDYGLRVYGVEFFLPQGYYFDRGDCGWNVATTEVAPPP